MRGCTFYITQEMGRKVAAPWKEGIVKRQPSYYIDAPRCHK
jgi:hypothetical protein